MNYVPVRIIEPPTLPAPLSLRISEARSQLGAMFEAGELAPLPDATRQTLRGLELFLFEAAWEASDLEMATASVRPRRRRLLRWLWRR